MRKMLLPAAFAIGGLLAFAAGADAASAGAMAPGIANLPGTAVESVQYWGYPYHWRHRYWRHRYWDRHHHYWHYYN